MYTTNVNTRDADPDLLRRLQEAEAVAGEVQVVFVLRPPQSRTELLTPDEIEQVTRSILERVERECGSQARALNIFRNIGSFVVQAAPAFVRKLMAQEEIASAVPNSQPGGLFIPPHKKKPL